MSAKPLLTYFARERNNAELPKYEMTYNYGKHYNEIVFLDDIKVYGKNEEISDNKKNTEKSTKEVLTLLMATQTFTKSIGESRDSDF